MPEVKNCPKCQKELFGTIELSSSIIDGISTVFMTETPDRNWILCDFCNQVICKGCCMMPDSGYCDMCLIKYKIAPESR